MRRAKDLASRRVVPQNGENRSGGHAPSRYGFAEPTRHVYSLYPLRYIYISLDRVFSQARVRNEFITRVTLSPRVLIKRNEHLRRTRNVFQR